MGIEYSIDYGCVPKQQLGLQGLIELLKNRDRAQEVIRVYRDQGDHRPEHEIGFEVTRRVADGDEETALLVAGEVLEQATVLDSLAPYCADCPANVGTDAFGCIGYINYPISAQAEAWLLEQLPGISDPMLFLMLLRSIREFGYSGDAATRLREQHPGIYFESSETLAREYAEMDVTSDILFEMTFQVGAIQPAHAAMLLLFYGALPRSPLDPATLMALTRREMDASTLAQRYPFLLSYDPQDDPSIRGLKRFLQTMYVAYRLGSRLLINL